MKGTYVSLSEGDVAAYDLAIDAQGREVSRRNFPPALVQ